VPTCHYSDPVNLGQRVLKDFTDLLDRLYPAPEAQGPGQQEAAAHRFFADSRCGVYVERRKYIDRLEKHARGTEPPLVIFGGSGSGKSALLANWLRLRREGPSQRGDISGSFWRRVFRFIRPGEGGPAELFRLLYCVGATPQSISWHALVRSVLEGFKKHFGLALDVPEESTPLRTAFARGLALAAARGKTVLVLDGLDRLEDHDQAGALSWLPEEIPSQVRLVVSTTPGPLLTEFRRRRWRTLEVDPLRRGERMRFVTAYLGRHGKRLSPHTAAGIAGAAPAANPLYLRTLLEELRVLGRHEEVPAWIRHYLAAATAEELYARVLARWEADFDRDRPALVRDTMTLLWASRHGLTEGELLELLKAPGDPLPFAVWSPMYLAAETLLVNRSGLLGFFHGDVRGAVERSYLADTAVRQAARRRLADYFAGRPWSPRKMEELPWQLAELGAWPELATVLADPEFLTRAWATYPSEVKALWARVEATSPFRLVDAYRPILEAPDEHPGAAWDLSVLLSDTGHLDEALSLGARLEQQARAAGDLARLQAGLGVRAVALTKRGNLHEALRLMRQQEDLCRQRGDRAALAVNLGHQGVLLRNAEERERALATHREAEQLCRSLQDWVGVAASLGNQGVLSLDRQDPGTALALFRQQEGMCRDHGDLAGLQASLGNQAAVLRARGQLDQALEMHRQEEVLCRRLYDPDGLQTCLGNQARVLQEQGDYDAALGLLQKREAICRQAGYREGLAHALLQQAALFGVKLGQAAFALHLAEEALQQVRAVDAARLAEDIEAFLEGLRSRGRPG
jgi:tetratricopeptide (TPR) repeat protein